MVFCLLKLFQHFLFVVLFRLLSLGEERANLDKIVEDLRLEAEFHLVVKLSLNLNCRTLVRLKSLHHFWSGHLILTSFLKQQNSRGEVLENFRHPKSFFCFRLYLLRLNSVLPREKSRAC